MNIRGANVAVAGVPPALAVAVALAALRLAATALLLVGEDGDGEQRWLAQSNCYGLPAEVLAEDAPSLVALLATEEGRRVAKATALRTLLGNATGTRALSVAQEARRINLCENAWFDWLPWLPCRVQSPPPRLPRPEFQDEERGGDSEGPLCFVSDATDASEDQSIVSQ